MEALSIVTVLIAVMVFIAAAYALTMCLLRWTPIIAAGALVALLADYAGATAPIGATMSLMVCMVLRHAARPLD